MKRRAIQKAAMAQEILAIKSAAVAQKRPEFSSHSQIESLKKGYGQLPSASVEIMVIQPGVF